MLVPGADRAGKQHPLFVAFAETLAAAGFLVLVPDIESLRALQLSAADAARIAGAVAHMAERPEGQRGVVLAAISYAVGPAVLAALRPDVAARIPAVLGIGGYHDAKAAVTFFTTGGFRGPQGDWQRQAATNHGRWVFLRANLQRLSSPEDRRLLLELARLRAAAPQAPVAHLTTRLGPEGRAVWALLSNREPARSRALIGALPAGIRRELEALDLSARDLSDLQAELILVHGRDDPVLPLHRQPGPGRGRHRRRGSTCWTACATSSWTRRGSATAGACSPRPGACSACATAWLLTRRDDAILRRQRVLPGQAAEPGGAALLQPAIEAAEGDPAIEKILQRPCVATHGESLAGGHQRLREGDEELVRMAEALQLGKGRAGGHRQHPAGQHRRRQLRLVGQQEDLGPREGRAREVRRGAVAQHGEADGGVSTGEAGTGAEGVTPPPRARPPARRGRPRGRSRRRRGFR